MQSTNHYMLATMLDDMANHDLSPEKMHHYKLAKIQMMEALIIESNEDPIINERHGAILMMSYALKWWQEAGLLGKEDRKGGE